MLGTPELKKLLSCATLGRAKMVLVGDAYQLSPVKARGGMFEQLCADLPWSQRLGEVWRMADPEERDTSLALRAAHVRARAAHGTGVAPTGTHVLAVVSSPPLSVLLRLMDGRSDDLFAELLTEQIGSRFGTGGSIAAGAAISQEEGIPFVPSIDARPAAKPDLAPGRAYVGQGAGSMFRILR